MYTLWNIIMKKTIQKVSLSCCINYLKQKQQVFVLLCVEYVHTALLRNLGNGFITVVWVFIFCSGPVGLVFTLWVKFYKQRFVASPVTPCIFEKAELEVAAFPLLWPMKWKWEHSLATFRANWKQSMFHWSAILRTFKHQFDIFKDSDFIWLFWLRHAVIVFTALKLHIRLLNLEGWLHSQHESIISESSITRVSAATPYILLTEIAEASPDQ